MTGTPSGVASMTPAQRSAILMPPNAGNAILHDRGALADGGIRDGRGRLLRLGAAVARRVERRWPAPRRAGEEPIDLIRPNQAGVDLIGPSLREPCLAVRGLPLRLAELDDAGLAKPRLRAHPCIHPLPQAHALDRQRHLGKLATHLAAPAPISARLLTGDGALLADHERHVALGEEERGRSADDAAADNDDFGLGRKLGCGLDGIGAWGHQTALLRMAHTLFVCSHSSILEARLSQA